jgi:hypothetical protein
MKAGGRQGGGCRGKSVIKKEKEKGKNGQGENMRREIKSSKGMRRKM